MKNIIKWIIKRFKYANKIDILKGILDGIDNNDIKNIYNMIDGRLNPILPSDNSYQYNPIPLFDTINNSILIIVQDNKIIGFNEFKIIYNNGWKVIVTINGIDQEITEDEHTNIYILNARKEI